MNLIEFFEEFPDEASCKRAFYESRIKNGIVCRKCEGTDHWWLPSKEQFECRNCHTRTTLRSGTVLANTKLPYRYWFIAMNLLTATKKSFSAKEIQRQLGHNRYEPIWAMLHKLRLIMGKRDAKYKMEGVVELDEGFFTSVKSKDDDSGAKVSDKPEARSDRQTKVLVAIQSFPVPPEEQLKNKHRPKRRAGFLKMQVIADRSKDEINSKAEAMLGNKSHAITDGWSGYSELKSKIQSHTPITIGEDKSKASKLFPWVHTAIGNAKKILEGVHHSTSDDYKQNYLNEFCYKFNRRYFGKRLFERLLIASVTSTWD
jgi:hypothetical protein